MYTYMRARLGQGAGTRRYRRGTDNAVSLRQLAVCGDGQLAVTPHPLMAEVSAQTQAYIHDNIRAVPCRAAQGRVHGDTDLELRSAPARNRILQLWTQIRLRTVGFEVEGAIGSVRSHSCASPTA